jgi:hypothetical protein
MNKMKEFYAFMNKQGYEVSDLKANESKIENRPFEQFKLGPFVFTYEDRIITITAVWCSYFGKKAPEINSEEFNMMTNMMADYHKIGRITFNSSPLHVSLDWSLPMLNSIDYSRVQLVYEYLADIYDKWDQVVFDIIHNDASFEELFMEME